jgi:predicted HicB family RNase H-like nuclease
MTKTDTLNLRVSADFKRRLMEEAAKEKRSVTNYLEVTLTNLWERSIPELDERKHQKHTPKR